MKKTAIFIGLFLFFVVATAPASLVTHFIPANSDLSYSGIEGTLWSGNLQAVRFKQLELGEVDYKLSIFPLLIGRAGAEIFLRDGDVEGELGFAIGREQTIAIDNANIEAKAYVIESLIGVPGVELNGNLQTASLSLELSNGKPVFAQGVTRWTGASLSWNGQQWQLDDFVIEWHSEEDTGNIVGEIANGVNQLGLRGRIQIAANGMMEFTGSIAQTAEKPIYDTLALFADGKPASGRLPLKFRKKIF